MKLLSVGPRELRVLDSVQSLVDVLDASIGAEAVAVGLDGRWYLLHSEELRSFQLERELDVSPSHFFAGHPEAPRVDPGATPSASALVFVGGDVVGAWVPGPERAAASRTAVGGGGPGTLAGADIPDTGFPEPEATRDASPAPAGRRAQRAERAPRRRRGGILRRMMRRRGAPAPTAPPPPEVPREAPAPMASQRAPAEAGEETIRRTPHMDAPEKLAKAPGSTFEVSVYTDTGQLRKGESSEGIALELPAGVDEVEVGVLLQLSAHFETAGAEEFSRLTISREEDRSEKLSFPLQVVDDPPAGKAAISALFTLRGRSCGQVARAWDWSGEGAEAEPVEPATSAAVSMPLHVDAEQSDLSIFVTSPVNDGVNYLCAVETPHLDGYTKATTSEPFAIPANGYKFVNTLLAALTDEDRTPEQRLRALHTVGHEAWEAAPAIVKRVLWALVDAGKPLESINIASVEPILPWELMIPRRFDGKEPRKLAPLGVEYAIGRWTRDDGQGPPPRLPVDSAFVVAPVYGDEKRELNKEEVEFVIEHLHGERVQPATIEALDDRFADQHASLLHFVCHGETGVEDDDEIELEQKERLRAREMETLAGFEELCQAKHPFVFLNSCSTGRAVPSLSGGSGFPRSFGNLGAHAIMAPLWPVDDTLAYKIAVEVYKTALEPDAPPVASILRDIRKRGYEEEDVDTFAAYSFFGDPLARLELSAHGR
jgi:hypothetical protein